MSDDAASMTALVPPLDVEPDGDLERGSVGSGLAFGAVSFLASVVLGLGSSVFTARAYGIAVIGDFALVTAPWFMLIQLSSLSEQQALVRRLATVKARAPEATGAFVNVLGFSTLLTTVVGTVIAAVAGYLLVGPTDRPALVGPMIVVLLGYAFVDNITWNLTAVLSAFQAGKQLFIVRMAQVVSFPIAALVLHEWTDSVWGLALGTVIGFAAALVFAVIVTRRYLALRVPRQVLRDGLAEMPELLRFSLKIAPGSLLGGFSSQAGIWLLGIAGTRADLGAYSRSANLATRFQDASFRVGEIIFPALVRAHREEDHDEFASITRTSLRLSCLALGLPAAVAAGVAPGALRVFGPGFERAATAFGILTCAHVLVLIVNVQGQILVAGERGGSTSLTAVARTVAQLGSVVPLGIAYGGTGIAISFTLGYAIDVVLRGRLIAKHLIDPGSAAKLVGALLRLVPVMAVGFVVARLLTDRFGHAGPAWLLAGVAGALAYGVAAFVTGLVTPAELAKVRTAAAKRRA